MTAWHVRYPWTEEDIAAFEARHPIGSKARLAFALALYTAQRRAEIVRLGWQHVRGGVIHFRQRKTGKIHATRVAGARTDTVVIGPEDFGPNCR